MILKKFKGSKALMAFDRKGELVPYRVNPANDVVSGTATSIRQILPEGCIHIQELGPWHRGWGRCSYILGQWMNEHLCPLSDRAKNTISTAGFTPIERELVEIDGEIQPSNMVLCEKDGKRVRVRLEPGSDHMTGAYYDDAGEQV